MGSIFNPVGENDWQGLNILLERICYAGTEEVAVKTAAVEMQETQAVVIDKERDEEEEGEDIIEPEPAPPVPGVPVPPPTKKELRKEKRAAAKAARQAKAAEKKAARQAKKIKPVTQDAFTELSYGQPEADLISITGVVDAQGVNIYNKGVPGENVTIPKTGVINKTLAGIAVPSSYFLNLRGMYVTATTRRYTADYIVLHDANGLTAAVDTVDVTNDISIAGPIAGGRDQAAAFGAGWIYYFIIYNPVTQDVSSLSSASATAPTLPTGYTYFVRVGTGWNNGADNVAIGYQYNDTVYKVTLALFNTGPTEAGTLQSLSISDAIPPTAKMFWGTYGITDTPGAAYFMGVSPDDTGPRMVGSRIPVIAMSLATDGGLPSGGGFFKFPVVTAQVMHWTASNTGAYFGILITGFTDDL